MDSERIDDLGTFLKWYNYYASNFYLAPSLNGVLSSYKKDKNLYCFNYLDNFVFFQPVIFDEQATIATVTESTVDVQITDGETQIVINEQGDREYVSKNIEYSIDGDNWDSGSLFDGLMEETQYIIYARTTEDLVISTMSITTLKLVIE